MTRIRFLVHFRLRCRLNNHANLILKMNSVFLSPKSREPLLANRDPLQRRFRDEHWAWPIQFHHRKVSRALPRIRSCRSFCFVGISIARMVASVTSYQTRDGFFVFESITLILSCFVRWQTVAVFVQMNDPPSAANGIVAV